MRISFHTLLIALVLGVFSSTAMAAEDYEDQINSYVSLNGGLVRTTTACNSPLLSGAVGSCTAGGRNGTSAVLYRLAYGYQFTPAWGIEVSAGDLAYASSKGAIAAPPAPLVGPAAYSWSMKTTGWAFAGTGTINLGKMFALFGKVGLVRAEFKEDINYFTAAGSAVGSGVNTATTHVMGGAGAQVNFTKSFALRGQVEYFGQYDVYGPNAPKIKLTMASAGLVYRF